MREARYYQWGKHTRFSVPGECEVGMAVLSDSPTKEESISMVRKGVQTVYYVKTSEDTEGLDYLVENHVHTLRLTTAGTIEHIHTKEVN